MNVGWYHTFQCLNDLFLMGKKRLEISRWLQQDGQSYVSWKLWSPCPFGWQFKKFQGLLANVGKTNANTVLLFRCRCKSCWFVICMWPKKTLKTSMCIHPGKATNWYFCVCHLEHCCQMLSDSATNTQYIYANVRHSKWFISKQRFHHNQGNHYFGVILLVLKHLVPPWHKCVAPRHYSQLCLEHLNGKAQGGWSKFILRFLLDICWNIRVCFIHEFARRNGSSSDFCSDLSLSIHHHMRYHFQSFSYWHWIVFIIHSCQVRYSTKDVIWYCWIVAIWIKLVQRVVTCVTNFHMHDWCDKIFFLTVWPGLSWNDVTCSLIGPW